MFMFMKQSLLFPGHPVSEKEGRPGTAEAHVGTSQADHFTAFPVSARPKLIASHTLQCWLEIKPCHQDTTAQIKEKFKTIREQN